VDQPVGITLVPYFDNKRVFRLTRIRDTGRRSDSAHGYIHSTRAHHQNLHLVCNTKVEKVIIENGQAVGVKVVPTKPLTPGQDHAKVYRARKQIIVSGGTLSSPLILQRSGIGEYLYSVVLRRKVLMNERR